MTIQFMRTWNGYEAGAVHTLAGAEETRLIGLGIARDYVYAMDGDSGGSFITSNSQPFASSSVLESAYPAASNPGASAWVGATWAAAVPYDVSAGAWVQRGAGGGGATRPRMAARTLPNGGMDFGGQPAPSRVRSAGGAVLFDAGAFGGTPVLTNCTQAFDSYVNCRSPGGLLVNSLVRSMELTVAGSIADTASVGVQMTGLSVNVGSATKLVFNIRLPRRTNSLSIQFDGPGGRYYAWTFSFAAARSGWGTYTLVLPSDTAAQAASVATNITTQSGTMTGTDFSSINGIRVNIGRIAGVGVASGDKIYISTLEVATEVKPAVCILWDAATGSAFQSQVIDEMQARGLVAGIRYHHIGDNSAGQRAVLDYAGQRGWGYFNGTLTRQVTLTTAGDVWKEYGENQKNMERYGYTAGIEWATGPGNSIPEDDLIGNTFKQLGIRFYRGPGQRTKHHGFQGVCQPYSFGTLDLAADPAASSAFLDGLVALGQHAVFFSHGYEGSGNIAAALDKLAALRNAGSIDVVAPQDMTRILDGLA